MTFGTTPGGPEMPREAKEIVPFIPTPERVSKLLDMDVEKVREGYKTVEERKLLVDKIMEEGDQLKPMHNGVKRGDVEPLVNFAGERLNRDPDLPIEQLEEELIDAQRTFAAKSNFLERTSPHKLELKEGDKEKVLKDVKKSKEKSKDKKEKTMWGRVWDTVTYLPRKHPVITTLLVLVAATAGIAYYFDALGNLIAKTAPNYSTQAAAVTEAAAGATAEIGLEGSEVALAGATPPGSSLLDIPGVPDPAPTVQPPVTEVPSGIMASDRLPPPPTSPYGPNKLDWEPGLR